MITVVGHDGSPLSPQALRALTTATLIVGGRRHLDAVADAVPVTARTIVMGDVAAALDTLDRHDGPAVVLASGDPGFFGIVRALRERRLDIVVLPAVSSVALAFARAGLAWDDAMVVSAHGRDLRPAINTCRAYPKVAVLTAPGAGPSELGAALTGFPRDFLIAERLGTPAERISECSPQQATTRVWHDPNVVLVLDRTRLSTPSGWRWPGQPASGQSASAGWALPEHAFEHRDQMITKAEVRALVLARLAPRLGTLVWDIGAGSGSVGIECARFGAAVVAVERDPRQAARIQANATRHGVELKVVEGVAPGALDELPDPDAVFVGGGGPAVIAAVAARRPARIVMTIAALERVGPARDAIRHAGYHVEGVQLQASRLSELPDGSHRLAATNPVLVLCGERR